MSEAYERIFEASVDELYVAPSAFMHYLHPEDYEKVARVQRRLFHFEDLVRFQYRIITPTGKTKCLDAQIIPTYDDEYGKLVVGISSDTTEIYEQQKLLEEAKNRAEESDNLKSAFLANMSHEIRTPLNGIIGFTELLTDSEVSMQEKIGFSELIKECSEQLMSIVTEVLELSKIKTGQIQLETSATNINGILLDVFNMLQHRANRKKIDFKIATDSHKLKEKIALDQSKLKRILVNLVENAIKFTPEGEVTFGCQLIDEQLHFFVKDTGIGIPEEEHEEIFESFRRGVEAEEERHRGAGIGLTISKAFAELMSGTIQLESQVDKGSTFTLQLPYTPTDTSNEKTFSNEIPDLSDATVLIVEDEQMNYFLLLNALSRTKADILWAQNGAEAVELVEENKGRIDLILMDIMMPEMNGIEATRLIKGINPKLPVIAQTACSLEEDKENILKAGCDDFLSKPLKKDKLFRMLHQHLVAAT